MERIRPCWRWEGGHQVDLVVLVFSGNDIRDNNSDLRYHKAKPKFVIQDEQLVLTNVPVPRVDRWKSPGSPGTEAITAKSRLKYWLLQSHLLHDIWFRIGQLQKDWRRHVADAAAPGARSEWKEPDIGLTRRIIRELRNEVAQQGARLVIVAVPSKIELLLGAGYVPYQRRVGSICADLKTPFLDPAVNFAGSLLRPYSR